MELEVTLAKKVAPSPWVMNKIRGAIAIVSKNILENFGKSGSVLGDELLGTHPPLKKLQ